MAGGAERFYSVKCGLDAVSSDAEYIAVHDGVRALVSKKLIIRTMLDAEKSGASIPVVDVTDSYRRLTADGSEIVSRNELRIVQTPQIFSAEILRNAYSQPYSAAFTDDASVVESYGKRISLVDGERTNLKLTTPDDLAWAEWWLTRIEE